MEQFYTPNDTFVPGSRTLAGKYYTSVEIFAQEIERIFTRQWLYAGRSEQISVPGQYFLLQVGPESGSGESGSGESGSGESIILLRDQAGKAHAFYNVCRHRGTRLCTQSSGRFPNSLQCPYHAWTYGLDGRLIGAPLMDEVPEFSKEDYPLFDAAVVESQGFLFINLAPQPEPFETGFGGFIGKFSPWDLSRLRVGRRIEYDVKANWKLIVQNYSECYHCPLIHPDLARKSPYRSGQNDLHEGPVLGGYMELNPEYGSLTMSGRACALPLGQVNGPDLERIYYYAIFPNMLLSLHPDYVMCHILWPRGPAATFIQCEWLFSPEAMEQPAFSPEDAVDFWDMTNRQDWHVCELSQRGVGSRVYRPSPYSQQESLLAAFDRQVLRALWGEASEEVP